MVKREGKESKKEENYYLHALLLQLLAESKVVNKGDVPINLK